MKGPRSRRFASGSTRRGREKPPRSRGLPSMRSSMHPRLVVRVLHNFHRVPLTPSRTSPPFSNVSTKDSWMDSHHVGVRARPVPKDPIATTVRAGYQSAIVFPIGGYSRARLRPLFAPTPLFRGAVSRPVVPVLRATGDARRLGMTRGACSPRCAVQETHGIQQCCQPSDMPASKVSRETPYLLKSRWGRERPQTPADCVGLENPKSDGRRRDRSHDM